MNLAHLAVYDESFPMAVLEICVTLDEEQIARGGHAANVRLPAIGEDG